MYMFAYPGACIYIYSYIYIYGHVTNNPMSTGTLRHYRAIVPSRHTQSTYLVVIPSLSATFGVMLSHLVVIPGRHTQSSLLAVKPYQMLCRPFWWPAGLGGQVVIPVVIPGRHTPAGMTTFVRHYRTPTSPVKRHTAIYIYIYI